MHSITAEAMHGISETIYIADGVCGSAVYIHEMLQPITWFY